MSTTTTDINQTNSSPADTSQKIVVNAELIRIHNTAIYEIDIKNAQLSAPFINPSKKEVQSYLKELVKDVLERHRGQEHRFASDRGEMAALCNTAFEKNFAEAAMLSAERLHRTESKTQEKVKQLVTLRSGSLLCSNITLNGETYLLFFKIDHAGFLDANFDWKAGLPEKQRAQKSAILKFRDSTVDQIWVGDTNAKISEYWWDTFLELTPLSTPESNTKAAFTAIEDLLTSTIKPRSNSDFWTLRNATISYFRVNNHCKFEDLIDSIFKSYTPENTSLDMQEFSEAAKLLPATKNFDSQFSVAPKIIKARIKTQINLAPNLELRITGEITNIKDLFGTDQEADGRKYLKIYSTAGYNEFHDPVTTK